MQNVYCRWNVDATVGETLAQHALRYGQRGLFSRDQVALEHYAEDQCTRRNLGRYIKSNTRLVLVVLPDCWRGYSRSLRCGFRAPPGQSTERCACATEVASLFSPLAPPRNTTCVALLP